MITPLMLETAYAKINLALHVRKRREDGYHELETLFAFVDQGDRLTAQSAPQDTLHTVGEFATTLDNPLENIVMQALTVLPRPDGFAITLEKNLPVAAGLGGGSADAGAIFRIVKDRYGLPDDWHAHAKKLGADVPACVESRTCIGRGTGTELEHIANDLEGMPVLLVNPRVAVPTGPIFKAWDGVDRGPMPEGSPSIIAQKARNDLEAPALALQPVIGDCLMALAHTNPWLARMSGSGATCFALYDDAAQRDAASDKIRDHHPDWWQMRGALR